ncbi:hypothetical protein Zm00014a_020432 [Zea mays]|uniref:Uncharacterized protein n=1 Tax=Zea mays TaxID=4577 RepID=A0A3L6EBM4_MAIZE|nr:hypothetical protein Zm00014a_020432 [Zea mays]
MGLQTRLIKVLLEKGLAHRLPRRLSRNFLEMMAQEMTMLLVPQTLMLSNEKERLTKTSTSGFQRYVACLKQLHHSRTKEKHLHQELQYKTMKEMCFWTRAPPAMEARFWELRIAFGNYPSSSRLLLELPPYCVGRMVCFTYAVQQRASPRGKLRTTTTIALGTIISDYFFLRLELVPVRHPTSQVAETLTSAICPQYLT